MLTTVSRLALVSAIALPIFSADLLMYIGAYTRGDSKGVYAFRFDDATGKLTPLGLAAEASNPSFVAVHPNRRFLYAVAETNEPGKGGAVHAYSIDAATGKLTLLNTQHTRGGGPC
jgi:6-phosphogluconolactonase